LLGSEKGPLTDSCEESDGTSVYINGGQFPNQQSDISLTTMILLHEVGAEAVTDIFYYLFRSTQAAANGVRFIQ
jgi:hypothetical protein